MREPALDTLQRWMALIVQHPTTSADGARTDPARALIPTGRVLAGEIVRPSATQPPLERLDVYNVGYLSRLVEVLESDYDAVRFALGEEAWRSLARDFVYAHPSHHPNLNGFGAALPEFLADREDVPHRAFLAELAQLQWAVTESFHAPEFEPIRFDTLQSLTPEQWAGVVLRANPSVRLLEFTHPTGRYLQDVLEQREPTIPAPEPSWLLVNRKDGRVWRAGLPQPVHAILAALLRGEPFAAALEAGGDHGHDVTAWFQEWSADGIFAGVEIP